MSLKDKSRTSGSKKSKKRIDQIMVERGLADNADKAGRLVMSGVVYSQNMPVRKASEMLAADANVEIKDKGHKWVSRGGLKLEHALKFFKINVKDKICIDVGASTGGFTDVLLTNGAKKIYAVDVGYGQLAWKLQKDERVVVLDKTNARFLDKTLIPDEIDVIVCDASFIGLRTILPSPIALAGKNAIIITLIKPQFEVKKEEVGEGGIVRDSTLHTKVCEEIKEWFKDTGWNIIGLTESPITGQEGNKEFLLAAFKGNYDGK